MKSLRAELGTIRRRSFAMSRGERIVGAVSSAAPVFDHHGEVVGAVSVASVSVRRGRGDLLKFGELARFSADKLSMELGWPGRTPAR